MKDLEILNSLVGVFAFAKDSKGRYLGANEKFAEAAGVDSASALIGKRDSDLVWGDQEDYFREGDIKAMSGEPLLNEPEVIHFDGAQDIITTKNALLTPTGELAGVVGLFTLMTGDIIKPQEGRYDERNDIVQLGERFGNAQISRKQAHILYHLLNGCSAKQIAEKVNLSQAGVRYNLNRLKRILQCSNQSELHTFCHSSGLTITIFECFKRQKHEISY